MLNYKEVHKDKMESILYYLESDFQQEAMIGWDILSLRGSECVLCTRKKKMKSMFGDVSFFQCNIAGYL